MNECRKSIPTLELLQENHSLMFWQFGKFHTSTSAQKLSSYIFCRENLSNQRRIVNWHQIVWIHTTNAYFIIKNLSKWHVTVQKKHTSTSAQKLSSYYLIPWWFDEFFYHNSWNFASKVQFSCKVRILHENLTKSLWDKIFFCKLEFPELARHL